MINCRIWGDELSQKAENWFPLGCNFNNFKLSLKLRAISYK